MRWQREGDDVCDGGGAGRAAKGAVLEMRVAAGVLMAVMCGHLRRGGGGTHFQQEGRAAGRHEACWDVGAKQQRRQQEVGDWKLPHRFALVYP